MTPVQPIPTPAAPQHFDYLRAAGAAGLSSSELQSIIKVFEADYPDDLMLRELHVLRACNAIARGMTTIAAVLEGCGTRAA